FTAAYSWPLVAHPTLAAILLEEPILVCVPTLLAQLSALVPYTTLFRSMDAVAPEIRALQIFARLVAQHILEICADELRREVPGRLEAVDHRAPCPEQLGQACIRRGALLLRLLSCGDVDPGSDHVDRLAFTVADQAPLVADPTVAAILLEEPILDRVPAMLEQLAELGFDSRQIFCMNTTAPEVRTLSLLHALPI